MKSLRLLVIAVAALAMMGAAADTALAKGNPMIKMETTEGDLVIELYKDKAPITVQNILHYVDTKFYDGLIFHRVVKGFVIQGGGYTKQMMKKATNEPIDNEATNGLKNDKYTLSMARTNVVNSGTSQFFVNLKDNANLDHRNTTPQGFGYAVFGKVVKGQDVVDTIGGAPVAVKNGMKDVPRTTVEIKRAYRVDAEGNEISKKKKG